MAPGFKVHNRSNEIIFCSVTNKSRPIGNAKEFEIKLGEHQEWARDGWEDVSIRSKDNTQRTALWINRGAPALIHFDGFDKPLTIFNDYEPEPGFIINNLSQKTVMCFVSSATRIGGNSAWQAIPPGHNMTRPRSGWEAIAVKSKDEEQRIGEFIDNKGLLMTVDFVDFNKPLTVHEPVKDWIATEHYAEAVRIADRSYAAGDSRASRPGGVTASIFKCDTLERLTTGKEGPSLALHNQIYVLGCLINHLKYGLAEPALVVSVTPDWVKVAAYTCEFDAIVVLGFPAKAIDLVGPGKTRPTVGTRLLVVSQFTYRGNNPNTQGVQVDITPGPRSLDKWYNFHPLVAQFVSDDSHEPQWKKVMEQIDEEAWQDTWERWVEWKATHGETYFRLGCPTKIQDVAAIHVDNSLPAYTAAAGER
ncbi:hypothetical protein K438DRAFT_780081 [Mycena galopus ATCC 62051]|nr:hypothetical protein K438DRAFT_780081 [Mycena galopus ATCC 62051]